MQSTDIKEIKAALWDQAFIGCTRVSCPMGGVVAIRRRKGQLLAMIRGWGRWYPVERVTIEIQFALPCSSERKVRAVFSDRLPHFTGQKSIRCCEDE
jgi:hypothetical protein